MEQTFGPRFKPILKLRPYYMSLVIRWTFGETAGTVGMMFLEDADKDPELADTFYWLIIIVGVLDVGSAIRLLTKFIGVFSLLLQVGYIGTAIGMLLTLVVPMILVAWWTGRVAQVLRKKLREGC